MVPRDGDELLLWKNKQINKTSGWRVATPRPPTYELANLNFSFGTWPVYLWGTIKKKR
jgi:hypothetical protein